ncbi:MAG: SDR family oxidoreductase [Ktedonobacterales bacterium]
MRQQQERRVVLLTGAAGGIGAATARELARRGCALALVDRRGTRLAALVGEIVAAGGQALAIVADMTQADDRQRMLELTLRRFGRLDALVNNAGTGRAGATEALTSAQIQLLFDLNVLAPIELTRLALPELRKQRGVIVNIASILGRVAMPPFGMYSATKFALSGWTDALRLELAPQGVRVCEVDPGSVQTEFAATAGVKDGFFAHFGIQPQPVARAVANLLRHPRRRVTVPFYLGPAMWLCQVAPGATYLGYRLLIRLNPAFFLHQAGDPQAHEAALREQWASEAGEAWDVVEAPIAAEIGIIPTPQARLRA